MAIDEQIRSRFDPMQRAREYRFQTNPKQNRQGIVSRVTALELSATAEFGTVAGDLEQPAIVEEVTSLPLAEPSVVRRWFLKRNEGADDTINIGLTNAAGEPIIVALNTIGSGNLRPLLSVDFSFSPYTISPIGVDRDAAGNFYVSSSWRQAVLKYSAVGAFVSEFFPTGKFYQGAVGPLFNGLNLSNIGQVAIDSTGRILIADTGNNRLVILTSAGVYSTGITGLTAIKGVCVDPSNNIYVAGGDATVIYVKSYTSALGVRWSQSGVPAAGFRYYHMATDGTTAFLTAHVTTPIQGFRCSDGVQTASYGTIGSGSGQYNTPLGIAYNPVDGLLYILDSQNNRVQKINVGGGVHSAWPVTSGSTGIAVDTSGLGNVIVSTTSPDLITKYDRVGTWLDSWGVPGPFGIGSGSGNILWIADLRESKLRKFDLDLTKIDPRGVRVNPSTGQVYVADANDRVWRFSAAGAVDGYYGIGFAPLDVELSADLLSVFFNDAASGHIIKAVESTGVYTWTVGSIGSGDLQFVDPNGITVDASGNIWVVDNGNSRVQKLSSAGAFLAAYGQGGNADGQFSDPQGIGIDPDGRIWVMDAGNGRVQVFDDAFTFQGKAGTGSTDTTDVHNPTAITFDANGVGHIADGYSNRISRLYLPDPEFLVSVASPTNGQALVWTGTSWQNVSLANIAFSDFTNWQHDHGDANDGGLVLPTSVTGMPMVKIASAAISSGNTSVTLNGVFTSLYNDYFFELWIDGQQTAAGQVFFQYGTGGSFSGSANYYMNANVLVGTTLSPFGLSAANAFYLGGSNMYAAAALPSHGYGFISSPNRAVQTMANWSYGGSDTAGSRYRLDAEGVYNVTTVFDGIRISLSAGSFRDIGRLTVYGIL